MEPTTDVALRLHRVNIEFRKRSFVCLEVDDGRMRRTPLELYSEAIESTFQPFQCPFGLFRVASNDLERSRIFREEAPRADIGRRKGIRRCLAIFRDRERNGKSASDEKPQFDDEDL